mmetsp:Transcript_67957/g.151784  ORF Transcript_67957/g.151784 Transcript_67957/m.151784 type:complete len:212 (-) Transcript_67957:25-660(-)
MTQTATTTHAPQRLPRGGSASCPPLSAKLTSKPSHAACSAPMSSSAGWDNPSQPRHLIERSRSSAQPIPTQPTGSSSTVWRWSTARAWPEWYCWHADMLPVCCQLATSGAAAEPRPPPRVSALARGASSQQTRSTSPALQHLRRVQLESPSLRPERHNASFEAARPRRRRDMYVQDNEEDSEGASCLASSFRFSRAGGEVVAKTPSDGTAG